MKGATSDEEIMRLANSAQQRFDLKGKRVLISGAANGLGRTMAFAFAARARMSRPSIASSSGLTH